MSLCEIHNGEYDLVGCHLIENDEEHDNVACYTAGIGDERRIHDVNDIMEEAHRLTEIAKDSTFTSDPFVMHRIINQPPYSAIGSTEDGRNGNETQLDSNNLGSRVWEIIWHGFWHLFLIEVKQKKETLPPYASALEGIMMYFYNQIQIQFILNDHGNQIFPVQQCLLNMASGEEHFFTNEIFEVTSFMRYKYQKLQNEVAATYDMDHTQLSRVIVSEQHYVEYKNTVSNIVCKLLLFKLREKSVRNDSDFIVKEDICYFHGLDKQTAMENLKGRYKGYTIMCIMVNMDGIRPICFGPTVAEDEGLLAWLKSNNDDKSALMLSLEVNIFVSWSFKDLIATPSELNFWNLIEVKLASSLHGLRCEPSNAVFEVGCPDHVYQPVIEAANNLKEEMRTLIKKRKKLSEAQKQLRIAAKHEELEILNEELMQNQELIDEAKRKKHVWENHSAVFIANRYRVVPEFRHCSFHCCNDDGNQRVMFDKELLNNVEHCVFHTIDMNISFRPPNNGYNAKKPMHPPLVLPINTYLSIKTDDLKILDYGIYNESKQDIDECIHSAVNMQLNKLKTRLDDEALKRYKVNITVKETRRVFDPLAAPILSYFKCSHKKLGIMYGYERQFFVRLDDNHDEIQLISGLNDEKQERELLALIGDKSGLKEMGWSGNIYTSKIMATFVNALDLQRRKEMIFYFNFDDMTGFKQELLRRKSGVIYGRFQRKGKHKKDKSNKIIGKKRRFSDIE